MSKPSTLSSSEAAERLNVSVRTVHRMVADGRLSAYDRNRAGYVFTTAAIDKLASTGAENDSGTG